MKERLFRNEKFWITYWKENTPMNELCSLNLNNRSLKCLKMFSYFLFSAHNTYTFLSLNISFDCQIFTLTLGRTFGRSWPWRRAGRRPTDVTFRWDKTLTINFQMQIKPVQSAISKKDCHQILDPEERNIWCTYLSSDFSNRFWYFLTINHVSRFASLTSSRAMTRPRRVMVRPRGTGGRWPGRTSSSRTSRSACLRSSCH